MFLPLPFLLLWLTGLASLAILGGGIYIVWAWYIGELVATAWLILGIAMLLYSIAGRFLVLLFRHGTEDEPRSERGGHKLRVTGPDGSALHVELHGTPAQPTLLMTH